MDVFRQLHLPDDGMTKVFVTRCEISLRVRVGAALDAAPFFWPQARAALARKIGSANALPHRRSPVALCALVTQEPIATKPRENVEVH